MDVEGRIEARKKNLLAYIKQLKELSGSPVEEEDLYAAGFSEDELKGVGWFNAPTPLAIRDNPERLEAYDPSARDNLRRNVSTGLQNLGLDTNLSAQLTRSIVGERNPTDGGLGMGLADFTPLGVMFGVEEGVEAAKQGYNSGDPVKTALGVGEAALNVASAIPGTKAVSKGIKNLADTFVDAHDPTVLRTFFGPTSKNADLVKLEKAKNLTENGASAQQVWKDTGWWNGPNGWRFEVDDRGLKLPQNSLTKIELGRNKEIFDHPDFWDSMKPNSNLLSTGEFSDSTQFVKQHGSLNKVANSGGWIGPTTSKPDSYSGVFNSNTGQLEASGRTRAEQEEISVHELQHAIQSVFGDLGTGSNPEWIGEQFAMTFDNLPVEIKPAVRTSLEYGRGLAHKAELEDRLVAIKDSYNTRRKNPSKSLFLRAVQDSANSKQSREVYELERAIENINGELERKTTVVEDYQREMPELAETLSEFKIVGEGIGREYFKTVTHEVLQNPSYIFDYKRGGSGRLQPWVTENLYRLEAGEVESRVAESRTSLTTQERAESFPGDWLDIFNSDMVYKNTELLDWLKTTQNRARDVSQASKNGYAEGGVVEAVDPISGNEIPPGAQPQEVRDDIPADLSEGEYVIPADVVRFLGLDKIEKLVSQSKEKLAEMASNGRIGGKPVEEQDDLPFSDEELMGDEAPVQMAVGGLVTRSGDRIRQRVLAPTTGGLQQASTTPAQPVLPLWMLDRSSTNPAQRESGADRQKEQVPMGIAGNVEGWAARDFTNAVKQRSDIGTRAVETGISKLMPFGKMALGARHNYLDKNVPRAIDEMLTKGVDTNGEPLTDQQIVDLHRAKADFVATEGYRPSVLSPVKEVVKSLIKPKEKTKVEEKQDKEKSETSTKQESEKPTTAVRSTAPATQTSQTPSYTPRPTTTAPSTRVEDRR